MEPILFYGKSRPYFEFSNWYRAKFTLDGKEWPTSEHYFMAMKTLDPGHREQIRKAATPAVAKNLAGPGGIIQLRSGWDGMKYNVMYRACLAKFEQNPELSALLLSTGDATIHEDCSDPWWGGGPNYPDGRDMLGRVLVAVRAALRAPSNA